MFSIVKEAISIIGCILESKRAMSARFVIMLAVLGATILMFIPFTANAIEDVPPAVPVDAVEVERLTLPEPINTKSKQAHKPPVQSQEAQATKATSPPNALQRFWKKIVNASNTKLEKKQKDKPWIAREQSQEAPQVAMVSSPIRINTKTIEANRLLKKILMPVNPDGGGFYVVELFTTQACPFCPKADAMMETYSALSHVIALSCHIDYFDVKEGSLSLPICSARQERYETFLKGQSKYTPQMVVNGRYDAVGYLSDKIAQAFSDAHGYPVEPLLVMPNDLEEAGRPSYHVELPQKDAGRYQIWLIAYDMPRVLTVKSGANAGKNMTYYNTVSKAEFLGGWDGQSKEVTIAAKFLENTKGFAFLVQDIDTGAIIMAGKNE
jgi:hypothetical protein